jgi:hypothetical protein
VILSVLERKVNNLITGGGLTEGDGLPAFPDSKLDLKIFDDRDSTLMWRDLVVALASAAFSDKLEVSTGVRQRRFSVQNSPDTGFEYYLDLGLVGSGTITTNVGPARPGTIKLVVGEEKTTDDGYGNFIESKSFSSGTIDYVTGDLEINIRGNLPTDHVYFVGISVVPLNDSALDISSSINTPNHRVPLIGSDVPRTGIEADRQLYTRDLILWSVIARASQSFHKIDRDNRLGAVLADPVVVDYLSSAVIDDAWSAYPTSPTRKTVYDGDRLTQLSFNGPDDYLVYRDVVIAKLVADTAYQVQSLRYLDGADRVLLRVVNRSQAILETDGGDSISTDDGLDLDTNLNAEWKIETSETTLATESYEPIITESTGEEIILDFAKRYAESGAYDLEPIYYILSDETNGVRTFVSSGGNSDRGSLIYDKKLRKIEYRGGREDGANVSVDISPSFVSHGNSVDLLLSVEPPATLATIDNRLRDRQVSDVEFLDAPINIGSIELSNVSEYLDDAGNPITVLMDSSDTVTSLDMQTVDEIPYYDDILKYRWSYLFQTVKSVHLNKSVVTGVGASYNTGTSYVDLDIPNNSNVAQNITNTPYAEFTIRLTPGRWTIYPSWVASGLGAWNITARVDGTTVWNGFTVISAANQSFTSTAIPVQIAASDSKILRFTVNSASNNTDQLQLSDVKILFDGLTGQAASFAIQTVSTIDGEYLLTEDGDNLESEDGEFLAFNEQGGVDGVDDTSNLTVDSVGDYISVNSTWLDGNQLKNRQDFSSKCTMVQIGAYPVSFVDVGLMSSYKLVPVDTDKSSKQYFLARVDQMLAIEWKRILSVYDIPTAVKSETWTADTVSDWYDFISTGKLRIMDATLPVGVSMIGKLGIIPSGVWRSGSGYVRLLTAEETVPTVGIIQPWMIFAGIRALNENFWTNITNGS